MDHVKVNVVKQLTDIVTALNTEIKQLAKEIVEL